MHGWQTHRLDDLCSIELGRTPARDDPRLWDTKRATGNVWLSIADLLEQEGGFVADSKEYVSAQGAVLCKLVLAGTLLLSFKLTLGRLAVAGCDLYTNEAIAALGIREPDRLDRSYLRYFLEAFDWDKATEGDHKIKGRTLNKAKLREIRVLVPPLREQRHIVAILDKAFEGIATAKANAEKNLQNAREVYESKVQSIFACIGEKWESVPLATVCQVKDGTHDSPKYVADGIPFITQKNIRADGLSFTNTRFISKDDHSNYYRRSNVAIGDILISMIGANRGMACLVDDDRIFSIKNVGLVKASSELNARFLLAYLKSPSAARYVQAGSKGGAQSFIGLTELRAFPVPVPPLAEQDAVATALGALSGETVCLEDLYTRKLAALNELKLSLLGQAFTGALTDRSTDRQVAEVA